MTTIPSSIAYNIVNSIVPYDLQLLVDIQFYEANPKTVQDYFVMLKNIPIHKEEKRNAALRLIGNMTGERLGTFLDLEKIANDMGLVTRREFSYGERWTS